MRKILLLSVWLFSGLWDMETEAMSVTGKLGKSIKIKCSHINAFNNVKYFCKEPCRDEDVLIRSNNKDSNGKYSIRDEGNTFYVTISGLMKNDSGTYWCGIERVGVHTYNKVILTITEGEESSIGTTVVVQKPTTTEQPAGNTKGNETSSSKHLTTVMCVTALLFVCLFILCLLLAVKHRRSGSRQNRETSSDYENMTPGVRTEPELPCSGSAPDCADLSASSPPDLCSHFTTKQRESTVSLGPGEYTNVDVSESIYQHLDLSRLEEHVYDSLHGYKGPKDGPLAAKEKINC